MLVEMLVCDNKTNTSRGETPLMYFLDGVLFPFEIFAENFNEEDKIYQILSQIDGSSVEKHFRYKGCGRRGSEKAAIFRALILKRLMGLTTTKSLVACLSYSPQLAHWCCFKLSKRIPSESTFSRFETKMSGLQLQKELNIICEKKVELVIKKKKWRFKIPPH